ncbi:MAG: TIR domain-containing protein [Acidobacteriota bacterium]
MKVTVVGSYRTEQRLLLSAERFREACFLIGERLAEWGHMLVVPHGEDDNTAETHALAGFCAGGSNHFYKCFVHEGDPALKAHFEAVEKSDAVILVGGLNGTYAAGLGALRYRKLIIPIPAFGGSAKDLCEIPEIDKALIDDIRNLDCDSADWKSRLASSLSEVLNAYPRVLIIHGRGDTGEDLRKRVAAGSLDKDSALAGLALPVIMNLRGKGALTVPDVFETLGSSVSAAIAIVTADDIGGFARSDTPGRAEYSARELKLKPRARENIWVEVGWFWGRLGRSKVFLWLKEDVQLPTDLQGAAWTQGSLEQSWPSIESFLATLRRPDIEPQGTA